MYQTALKIIIIHWAMHYNGGTAQTQKLIKDQFVDCRSDRMEVHLRFFAPFDGFIYAENYYEKPHCRWYGNLTKYMNLTIPIINGLESFITTDTENFCGTEIDKDNGKVMVILVVSPLRGVLVSGIAHLQISCLFTVKEFTITFPRLHIMPIKAEADLVTGMAPKPTLFMQILEHHGINGAVLSKATVGQEITLDVVLENAAIYDFTIYSCIAHDGSRSPDASVQVIDANGCGVQLVRAIEDRVYSATVNGAKHIYIYMYGFQFTSQFVHFECQARTCVHSCQKQQCGKSATSSTIVDEQNVDLRQRRNVTSEDQVNITLYAVLQMKPQIIQSAKLQIPINNTSNTQSITIIPIVAGFMLVTLAIAYAFYLKKRKRSLNMSDYRSESSYTDSTMYARPTHSFIYL